MYLSQYLSTGSNVLFFCVNIARRVYSGDQQFVCHKSSNLRSNRSDQVYNIQNKHSRYPPRSKNISHARLERYSIPLQISDLTNNTQIHTFFRRIEFLAIFIHLLLLDGDGDGELVKQQRQMPSCIMRHTQGADDDNDDDG